ncbi:replication initiation factor domain-containing protein [Enterococcus caccae]|uniref:Replication initiation protein-like C-terminal domain-containing protein n=1 Tax=Enterococcus caccae ATCC BAA-1240 TaxID=1158612 RepID=R3WC66_9ENTE|nr:replication initiation factor domain-containing protein [Enterococcus caccae]EOL45057.1 hypothetical protein UC7_01863 [Enterococcus caccae ATCC BAA-1240]EOT58464.1 hypothetical protein I580_02635 [Enterococcus caccae ATCC BAA-1240]OJG24879.1 hypothetical protein RU98_GL001212 [Enterococcus caccae]
MLQLSTDEFTVVLQSNNKSQDWENWGVKGLILIEHFEKLSKLDTVFGEAKEIPYGVPQGYAVGYIYGDNPFYFCVAYHPEHIEMGIIVKFSAHAWAVFQENYRQIYKENIQIHNYLQMIQSEFYTSRLSRIDIAFDFMNEKVSVNTIYNQLSKGNQVIRNNSGRKNSSTLSAVIKNNHVSTFYIGSRGKNIKAFLRVYDKKLEQEQTYGFRYIEAVKLDDWTRFEAVFKGDYAHSLYEELLKINTENELKVLLVSSFTDRYQFFYKNSGKQTVFTKKMLALIHQTNFSFYSPSPRDNQLKQSIEHILHGSGLFPTMFKINEIWGYDGLKEFKEYLMEEYAVYEPNEDVTRWVNKYRYLYKKQGKPFGDNKKSAVQPTKAKNNTPHNQD